MAGARRAPSHNRVIGRRASLQVLSLSPSHSRYTPPSIVPGSCRILREGIRAFDPDREPEPPASAPRRAARRQLS